VGCASQHNAVATFRAFAVSSNPLLSVSIHDRLQIIVIFAGMSAADRIGLMVNMRRGIVGIQNQPLDLVRTEMEDPSFPTIDPDHGMIMRRGHRRGLS
jgi:hypothetical protein